MFQRGLLLLFSHIDLSIIGNIFGLLGHRTKFRDLFADLEDVFVGQYVLQAALHGRVLAAFAPDHRRGEVLEQRLVDLHDGVVDGQSAAILGEDDVLRFDVAVGESLLAETGESLEFCVVEVLGGNEAVDLVHVRMDFLQTVE